MLEVRGKDIVAQVKASCRPFREALSQTEIAIIRFLPPPGIAPLKAAQYEAARYSTESKRKTFSSVGCAVTTHTLSSATSVAEFEALLERANRNPRGGGTIIQNPIPDGLQESLDWLDFHQDLDAMRPGNPNFAASATSETLVRLVTSFARQGNTVAVVGSQGFVGGGAIALLEQASLQYFGLDYGDPLERIREADLVITATGSPELLDERHLAPHHRLVVDAGFVPQADGSIKGDVKRSAYAIPQALTPVPGGVGPFQMATLLERLVRQVTGEVLTPWMYSMPEPRLSSQPKNNPEEADAAATDSQAVGIDPELVETLQVWYFCAQLNRWPADKLAKIQTVVRQVSAGMEISESATESMTVTIAKGLKFWLAMATELQRPESHCRQIQAVTERFQTSERASLKVLDAFNRDLDEWQRTRHPRRGPRR